MIEDFKAFKTADNILLIGLTEHIKGYSFEIIWQHGQHGTARGMHDTVRKYDWHPKVVWGSAIALAFVGREEPYVEIGKEQLKSHMTEEFRTLIGKKANNAELQRFIEE